MVTEPTVVAIFISGTPGAAMREVPSVVARPGSGLEGDRYASGAGTFSRTQGSGRHVTLIEEEALDAVAREHRIDLPARLTRRNLLTRGVPLNDLVGRELRIGDVRLIGMRLCEPCAHLQKLTGLPVIDVLRRRGGLRCDILEGGVISAGAVVVV